MNARFASKGFRVCSQIRFAALSLRPGRLVDAERAAADLVTVDAMAVDFSFLREDLAGFSTVEAIDEPRPLSEA